MAHGGGAKGYQPQSQVQAFDFQAILTAISHNQVGGDYRLRHEDRMLMLGEMSKELIQYVSAHSDGPTEMWCRDKHWRVERRNKGKFCKDGRGVCAASKGIGASMTIHASSAKEHG